MNCAGEVLVYFTIIGSRVCFLPGLGQEDVSMLFACLQALRL